MRHRLKSENRGLRSHYADIKAERDDLQIEVWELEDLVEELFQHRQHYAVAAAKESIGDSAAAELSG